MDERTQQLFEGLPEIPDEFYQMIKEDEQSENMIFYKREKGYAKYYCCQCGKEYVRHYRESEDPFEEYGVVPKRNENETCKKCGETGKLEWERCAGEIRTRIRWYQERYYIWQVDKEKNLVIREFKRETTRQKGRAKSSNIFEIFRAFLAPGMCREYDYIWWGSTWYETKRKISKDYEMTARIYSDPVQAVKASKMRYFPLMEYLKIYNQDACFWTLNAGVKCNVMCVCAKAPVIEMIHKIGMDRLARVIMQNDGVCRIINKRGKTLEKILRIKKEDIPWIRSKEDEISALRSCQTMRKNGMKVNDKTRNGLYELVYSTGYTGRIEAAECILKYMSLEKMENRCKKYAEEYGGIMSSAIQEYADYLKMRAGLGYDMTNEVYLHPKNLKGSYKEIRKEDEARKNEKYISEMEKKYGKIKQKYQSLDKKYGYEEGEFLIRPAENAGEIVIEGRTLHHCVGSETQGYMRRHNEGKRFILFLRERKNPDIPYITVEIDKNFKVQQWYGENDTKPDKEEIDAWLGNYADVKTKKPEMKAAV